jgi:tetratricopeptide (TPR) repeat protein
MTLPASPTLADPFDRPALDEATELRALTRALQLAEGFKLYFVSCNQPQQQRRLSTALRAALPELTVQELQLSGPIPHLLDALQQFVEEPPPGAVFVSGLEYSLPVAQEADATPFVANLNAARNSFPHVVPCPLVLWVPEYVLVAIARGAPDFFSVRSGVYFFAASPEDTTDLIRSVTAQEEWAATALSLEEKQERITAITSLLAEFEGLPSEQRNLRTEAQLHWRLGNLLETLGAYTDVARHYERTLVLVRKLHDRVAEAVAVAAMGAVYTRQGKWGEAEAAYRESLDILRETGNRLNEGSTLANLGLLYLAQNRFTEAETALCQSLAIFRALGDRVREARALINLGSVYTQRLRLREAEAAYQQSLALLSEVDDRENRGIILGSLGLIYRMQGRLPEAEEAYRKGLAHCRAVSDRTGEATTLANLALLREARGDISGAIEIGRQSLAVFDTTEETRMQMEVRNLLERLEKAEGAGNDTPSYANTRGDQPTRDEAHP